MRIQFTILAMAALVFQANIRADSPESVNKDNARLSNPGQHASPGKMIDGDFTVGKALKLLYGNYAYYKEYDGKNNSAKWRVTPEQFKETGINEGFFQADRTVYTGAVMPKSFIEAGRERCFL